MMSIYGKAMEENKNKSLAYNEMNEKYAAMPYQDAFNLLKDAQGVLATKGLLEIDIAQLSELELSTLIEEAKQVGNLAESCKVILSARQKGILSKK